MFSQIKKKASLYELYVILFSVFWVGFIGIDYINKHPVYYESIIHFKYYKLLGFLILYGCFFSWFLSTKNKSVSSWSKLLFIPFVGLSFFTILFSMALAYSKYYFIPLTSADYIQFLSNSGIVSLSGIFVLLSLYSLGSVVAEKFLIKKVFLKSNVIIDLTIGLMLFTFLLIPLAALHLLYVFVLLPILILFFVVRYKYWAELFKNIRSLAPNYSALQFGILFLALLFAALNFAYILSAYPLGFDSRNYYVNLSLLIAENHGFVKGFQPHNWELFTAASKVLTGKNELILFMSYAAGLVSAWATYHLARWFKIDQTWSLITALLLLSTPAVSHQMYIELKVDLSLLFLQISTLLIYLKYERLKKGDDHNPWHFIILLGLLFGFGLGIKLLHFFLIYGIFCTISYHKNNKALLFATSLLGLGLVLILQLDDHTGLRSFHPNADIIGYALTSLGLITLAYSGYKDFSMSKKTYISLAAITLITLITFSPWVYKSYREAPSSSILQLIRGNSPGHVIDLNEMRQLYNSTQDK